MLSELEVDQTWLMANHSKRNVRTERTVRNKRWAQRGRADAAEVKLYHFVLLLHSLRAASQGLFHVLGNCVCCQEIWST